MRNRAVKKKIEVPSATASQRRALNGKRLWKCNACGSLEPWSEGHVWYGSYRDLEDDGRVAIACSDQCRQELVGIGIIPKDAKYLVRP